MYDPAPDLQVLFDVNQQIKQKLAIDDFSTEEIHQLVDTREQAVAKLLLHINRNPSFAHSERWLSAITDTQAIVELMSTKTMSIGQSLRKYRYGNKSVQQYKKFT